MMFPRQSLNTAVSLWITALQQPVNGTTGEWDNKSFCGAKKLCGSAEDRR